MSRDKAYRVRLLAELCSNDFDLKRLVERAVQQLKTSLEWQKRYTLEESARKLLRS